MLDFLTLSAMDRLYLVKVRDVINKSICPETEGLMMAGRNGPRQEGRPDSSGCLLTYIRLASGFSTSGSSCSLKERQKERRAHTQTHERRVYMHPNTEKSPKV